jgi:hypothetical protein
VDDLLHRGPSTRMKSMLKEDLQQTLVEKGRNGRNRSYQK